MIAVDMRDEDFVGVAEVITGLNDAACDAAAGINQIKGAIYDQEIGRLRAVWPR